MDIASVSSSNQVSQANRQVAPVKVAAAERKVWSAETVKLEKADKVAQIMQHYDLRNIAYHERGKLAGELYEAGVITGEQRMMMSAPQGRHIMVNGLLVFDDYGKKDYLKESELALVFAEKHQASDISSLTHRRNMVNLLHNLDALSAKA